MDIPTSLHNWAIKEMGFVPSGQFMGSSSPTVQDFSRLCRGPMNNIWTYMIQYVRSSATVHKICQNLKLQDIHMSVTPCSSRKKDPKREEIEKLKAERARCQANLKAIVEKLGQTEKKCQQIQNKLLTDGTSLSIEKSKLDAMKKKTAFLHLGMQVAAEKNCKLEQSVKYLKAVGTSLSAPRFDDSSCLQWALEDRSEGLCQFQLESVCSGYSDLLLELMIDTRDGETLTQKQQRLIDMMSKLSTTFSAVELFTALNKLSRSAVDEITSTTLRCNHQQDLEVLKFDCSSGEMVDVARAPEITQSVASVLEETRAKHIKTFFNNRRAQNNVINTQKMVEDAKKQLWMQLQAEIDDPGIMELVQRNMELQLELTACAATLNCLQTYGKELAVELQESSRLSRKLEEQIKQIKTFEQNKAAMLQNIQKCISLNMYVRGQLNKLQFQIANYVEENLIGKDQALISATELFWGHMEEELNLMKVTPVYKLQAGKLESESVCPLQSLSIYTSVVPFFDSRRQSSFDQIQRILGCPSYKSTDAYFLHVLQKKLELAWLKTFHKALPDTEKMTVLNKGGRRKYPIADLEGLLDAVAEHDQIHIETTLPLLKKMLTDIQCGLDLCIDLRTVVNDWWEQPALHIPLFKEWKSSWKKEDSKSSES